jgi:hypothetical protein
MSLVIAREPIVIEDFAPHIVDVAAEHELMFKVDVAFDSSAHDGVGDFALRVSVGSLESLDGDTNDVLPAVLESQPRAREYDGRWNWALIGLDRDNAEEIAADFCRAQMALFRNAAVVLFGEPRR